MLMTVKIAPGERIPSDTVARPLGISQTPIREALSQLEAEKLVYKTTNVGYRASPQMPPKKEHDLYTLRLLIEPSAAARAAEQRGTASDREQGCQHVSIPGGARPLQKQAH